MSARRPANPATRFSANLLITMLGFAMFAAHVADYWIALSCAKGDGVDQAQVDAFQATLTDPDPQTALRAAQEFAGRSRVEAALSPLALAAGAGRNDVVAALLDAGCDPNAHAQPTETPLFLAARSGNPLAVRLLLDRGAEVTPTLADATHGFSRSGRSMRLELATQTKFSRTLHALTMPAAAQVPTMPAEKSAACRRVLRE
jgi:hypothetical protein